MRAFFISVGFALLAACSPPPTEAPQESDVQPAPEGVIISVAMARTTEGGTGEAMGTVRIRPGDQGALFDLNLFGLPPGAHGFHVHENANCGPEMDHGELVPAGAAGGHWDPDSTGVHAGPEGDGHLGDLPRIDVGSDGRAISTLIAPRIDDIERLRGHALMIHAGGDTYSDEPDELGGGGARLGCGLIG